MPNGHRLGKTLEGHKHQLMAVFSRSAAHKLPGSKGVHREGAVAQFLATWVPHRFTPTTNVFVTSPHLGEFHSELDLVLHDSYEGGRWPLDADELNVVLTWDEVRAVVEIKSVLNEVEWKKARQTMLDLSEWAHQNGADDATLPHKILFAFKTDPSFYSEILELFAYASTDDVPYDAIVLLDHGAWFGPRLELLEVGLRRGLVPSQVENDGSSLDRLILRFCMETRIPEHFRCAADTPEGALLALAVVASYCCIGEDVTRALLSALMRVDYAPVFTSNGEAGT